MNKKIAAMVVTVSLAFGVVTPVTALPNNGASQQTQQNKSAFEKAKQKRLDLEKKIEILDSQIEKAMRDLDSIKSKITKIENDIESTKVELEKAQKEVDKEQDLFNQRMRAMYINGVDGYLSIILDSESFSDFLTRMDTVKNIVNFDKKIMKQLNDKKEAIEKKKSELDSQKDQLEKLKKNSEEKVAKMQKDKKDQNKLVEEARKEEKRLGFKLESSQSQINSVLRQAQERTPSRGGSVSFSGNGNSVVSYAAQFQGTRYVYGGTSPSGFDCSGFVQYVYRNFGVNLPRTSQSQFGVGTAVSDLQPGDLVFFRGAGHVGIYVGGGQYIHAPRTGDVVKIAPLGYRNDFCGARRVR